MSGTSGIEVLRVDSLIGRGLRLKWRTFSLRLLVLFLLQALFELGAAVDEVGVFTGELSFDGTGDSARRNLQGFGGLVNIVNQFFDFIKLGALINWSSLNDRHFLWNLEGCKLDTLANHLQVAIYSVVTRLVVLFGG